MAMITMADSVDVGHKQLLSEKRTLYFNFHGFEDLPHKRGAYITSPALRCHGCLWAVRLYPRGHSQSASDVVYISAYLECHLSKNVEKRELKANYSLQVANIKKSATKVWGEGIKRWGWKIFATRAEMLNETRNYLVDGTLTVKVDLQAFLDKPHAWTPTKMMKHAMQGFFQTGEFSDVAFKVGDKRFLAHKLFLAKRAPLLLQFTEGATGDVEIDHTDPSAFEKMLRFIYTDELPSNLSEEAETLLDVANKFGCTSLKIFAETELAMNGIMIENTARMFLLADCKNCALLKEAAMLFFVDNAEAVMRTRAFSQAKESNKVLVELMEALANPPSFSDKMEETGIDRMGVSALRRKLDEMGLDVDGTREMLVKRLQTNKSD